MANHYDIVVIGGGMAGSTVAAHLAWAGRKVLVLEMEQQPGYHATGRSAAVFAQTYGGPAVRALTRASRSFYHRPPDGFCEAPLLTPRGELQVAFREDTARLDQFAQLADVRDLIERITPDRAIELCPVLKRELIAGATYERETSDIDVNAVQQGFIRVLRARGGALWPEANVSAYERETGGWRIDTGNGTVRAEVLVNAAGAWAGEVGRRIGAKTPSFQPRRRTAVLIDAPGGLNIAGWPLVIDAAEHFYFKPDAGAILVSPADETPSPPVDAQPDELDVAIAIDRLQAATTIAVRRVRHKWAGLRTFVPDRAPVIGFAGDVENLFWVAGLGGYGIQSAPAVGALAASLIAGKGVPSQLTDCGVSAADLSPSRPGAY
jgi:D-arginine dehydrogenase